ncbi:DUF4931 domain-containing protein [uncultured Mitsuokella sp.]|uniref:DUF4931 domain-containing protein n=1 Tax=uncultured Mitsuokella sp. TaxID=453120 RepID=UPI0026DB593A|nr:DUF4931 domain-containing protein [uncultured Mitsuokella sp.]
MDINLMGFDMSIGRQKPETIRHQENACPFCDRSQLTDILATEGDMIFLRNKYNVIEGADQFVLIEGSACHSDIPDYTKEHMHALIRFGLSMWQDLLTSGRYEAVLFFKNYGPFSGGTIRHPHMQLIGLPHVKRELLCQPEEFEGPAIARRHGVTLNVSTVPRIGFWEFNIVPESLTDEAIATLADFIQLTVDYLMHRFAAQTRSYNIFFYENDGRIAVKILPRFATPPIYVGYGIHFRPSSLTSVIDEMQKLYFAKE